MRGLAVRAPSHEASYFDVERGRECGGGGMSIVDELREVAMRLMAKGGRRLDAKTANKRQAKAEIKKDMARIVIRARSLSKGSDWGTVK